MGTPSELGNAATATILAAFVKAELIVLVPFGDAHPYDLVVDNKTKFIRVQCKSGWIKNNVIITNLNTRSRKGGREGYSGLADIFAIYCAELGKIYLVPVRKNLKSIYLRLSEPKNNQKKVINWARDYEFYPGLIDKIAESLP